MTENPTILSPSGPSQPPSLANSTTTPEDAEDPSGEINCICEISDDDGFTICCDKCDTWQHLVCVELTRENLPAKYYCPKCSPRTLDVSKAKDHQRKRRAEEQAKRSHKKKRPAATSHKKKDHTNGSNGTAPRKVSSTSEKAVVPSFGKIPSPKEMQQPTGRKRGHRASQTANTVGPHPPSQPAVSSVAFSGDNASPNSPDISFSIRNSETEGDIGCGKSTENYKFEYTDISTGPDRYASADVQAFMEDLVSSSSEFSVSHGEPLIHYDREKFASIDRPKTSVRKLTDFSKPYSRPVYPRWSLVLETPVSPGQLVTIYKGEVVLTQSRQNESRNQFDMLRHPKLYVLFHPNLPIYIDARKCGSEARFIRRSCQPNLEIRTVIIEKSEVCFGLFAKDAIKAETQLTLCWDLGEDSEAYELAQEGFDWNLIGDCQCSEENECTLARIKNGASALKPSSTNGTRKRQPIKRNPSTEPHMPIAFKDSSPERGSGLPNDDEEEDNRSISAPSSRSKPRSRDLTPSTIPDTAVETGEMTGREARKFKEVLSRIEKQQQEEQLPPSVKRRKRNSTVSLPTGAFPLASPGIEWKDGMKGVEGSRKQKFLVNQRSPYSPPVTTPGSISIPGEYSVTDASVGRRESNSPVHSEPGKQRRRGSVSPIGQHGNGGDSVKHRSKTIVKPPRPQYKNASVQTDDLEDEPLWWQQDHIMSPPRPPRLPLRKRLMQSLLRDREEAVAISIEDRKRKHDDTASHSPESSPAPKSIKLSSLESASVKSTPVADSKQSEATESIALIWAAANTVKSAAQDSAAQASAIHVPDPITKLSPPLSTHPTGPALADIFADSDISASHQVQGAAVPLKPPPEHSQNSVSNDQPHVNGFRSSELHVQLPPGPSFPNAPTTPSIQSTLTPNTIILQSPLSVVPNLPNSNSTISSLIQPSPTRTKKLSLQDYGKRKQKVETNDKVEEKPGMKSVSDDATLSLNALKASSLASSEEQRKIFDSSSSLMPIVSLPSPEAPSQKMMLDPPRVPAGPKEHRAGSPWSVR